MRLAIVLLATAVTVAVMFFDFIFGLQDLRIREYHHFIQWVSLGLLLFYCVFHTTFGHGGPADE